MDLDKAVKLYRTGNDDEALAVAQAAGYQRALALIKSWEARHEGKTLSLLGVPRAPWYETREFELEVLRLGALRESAKNPPSPKKAVRADLLVAAIGSTLATLGDQRKKAQALVSQVPSA